MKTKEYDQVEDTVYIGIEDLAVDPQNIRQGEWGHEDDEDLVRSVKQSGVLQPIAVRPLEHDEDDRVSTWGIVAGSRRYNAAIDAGLDRMPCRIKDFDETEAMLFSMEENRNRKDSAKWRDVDYVGEVIERLSADGVSKENAKQRIMKKIGISRPTVNKYHEIYQLPEKVRALIRKPKDLTQSQRDYYDTMAEFAPSTIPVNVGTLEQVYTHFNDWDEREQVKVALELDEYTSDDQAKLAAKLADNPGTDLDEIVRESSTSGRYTRTIQLDYDTKERIGDAAVDRNQRVDNLLEQIVKQWLRNHGYCQSDFNKSLTEFAAEGA